MDEIEIFVLIVGILLLPYGLYDIITKKIDITVKFLLILISLSLLAIELLFVIFS
ncbi:hypothetical protein HS7_18690 [Sulfolobales archaeon HS-7]|nr:hypothetical protein HS7_18690 [Sulfolobales archaeon HS-7]